MERKTVVLTGASRGIGRIIAKSLAENGYDIIGVARSESGLSETENIVTQFGAKFSPIPADLSDQANLFELYENVLRIQPNIFALINNAGVEYYQHFEKNMPEDVIRILNTNLLAPIELTRLFWKELEASHGAVVSIGSLAGKKGVAYNSLYSASKAGLIKWSEGLRQEKKSSGVGITVVCPGYIADTGMFFDGHIDPPGLLGTSPPEAVAEAVLKALTTSSREIIVNKGPIRPLLSLNQIAPKFGDWIVKLMGVVDLSRRRISER